MAILARYCTRTSTLVTFAEPPRLGFSSEPTLRQLKISYRSADNHIMANLGQGRANPTDGLASKAHENVSAAGPSKEGERWLLSVVQNTSDVATVVGADGTVR